MSMPHDLPSTRALPNTAAILSLCEEVDTMHPQPTMEEHNRRAQCHTFQTLSPQAAAAEHSTVGCVH